MGRLASIIQMGPISSQGPSSMKEGGRRRGQSDVWEELDSLLLALSMEEPHVKRNVGSLYSLSCKRQGNRFSPQTVRRNTVLPPALWFLTQWEPFQMYELQNCKLIRSVSFEVTEFVVICYSTNRKLTYGWIHEQMTVYSWTFVKNKKPSPFFLVMLKHQIILSQSGESLPKKETCTKETRVKEHRHIPNDSVWTFSS